LHRALGDGQGGIRYVVTVPGRGYNFVAPVPACQIVAAKPAALLQIYFLSACAVAQLKVMPISPGMPPG
jgi:DNA-binding winged helix-turn-helix (wHTH) protein